VNDIVFVAQLGGWRGGGLGFAEDGVNAAFGIGIEHEKLPGMGASVTEQFQPVGFGAEESLLVTKDDVGGIIFEFARAYEATAGTAVAGSGNSVFLSVGIESGCGILAYDLVSNPALQGGSSASVDVVLGRVVRKRSTLFNGDQIVRIDGVIALLHGRRDLVVRLSENAIECDACRIVAKRAEGLDVSHEVSE